MAVWESPMQRTYYVKALWDDEAGVWYSESDIPGLVIEAAKLDEFEQLMRDLAPELLSDNTDVHGGMVSVHLSAQGQRTLELAVA